MCLVFLGIHVILQTGPSPRADPGATARSSVLLSAVLPNWYGTFRLADLTESTRPNRMSPFIHLPDPLGWESVWIAEELFEKVDKGIINCEEYMLEKYP